MASATIYVDLDPAARLAIDDLIDATDDLTAATDALADLIDDDITVDTDVEFGELLEADADPWSRACQIAQTIALIVIAIALLTR